MNKWWKRRDMVAEIARLQERVDRLWKAEVNASDECERLRQEIDQLRANQIPGRCGECGNKKIGKNTTGQYEYCGLGNIYTETGFCQEWKPKV